MAIDPARRRALLGLKLGALVRDHLGEGSAALAPFPWGAALLRDGSAWVLVEDRPTRALGPALAWARLQQASDVHLLVEADAGTQARRAEAFAFPITVHEVEGRVLRPASPAPVPPPALLDDDLAE